MDADRGSWLARYLKELIESDLSRSNIWLEGEVSNFTRSSAGHLYFTLKDEEAQFRCVMFRRASSGAPIESGGHMKDIKGQMIRGRPDIVSDTAEALKLMRASAKQRGTPEDELPTEPRPGVAYIRITPKKYISWDYSRES